MREALAWAAGIIAVVAFIFGIVFAVFGTILAYDALFPAHGNTVCLLSHDEEHSGYVFTLCDKRVPR